MARDGEPRLELQSYLQAEERIRASILRRERGQEWSYPGRDEDLARIRRWQRERGPERVMRILGGGGS